MLYVESQNKFENGFSSESDIFNRKPLFNLLMNFVKNAPETGLVLALEDKWGNGKTSFLKMMTSEINNDDNYKVNVIYYDAFENDYHTDPFLSLTSEIYESLENNKGRWEKAKERIVNTGKKVGAGILKGGINYVMTNITGGVLNGTHIEPVKEKISEAISKPLEDYAEQKITSSKRDKGDILAFKETLTSIYKEHGTKTLFIVDELDRARPDFSLDLLEKIKHLFSVEGFVFLLSVNREQFERSIEQRYGNIDSRIYLNKFVNYWFSLPKINSLTKEVTSGARNSTIHSYLINIDKRANFLSRNGEVINTLSFLIDFNDLSLRETERCYALLCAIDNRDAINNFKSEVYLSLIALIAFLKITNHELLDDIIKKRVTKETALKAMNSKNVEWKSFSYYLYPVIHLLDYHYATEEEMQDEKNEKRFSDLVLFYRGGKKQDIFKDMHHIINNLHIG
ncbi:KAP family P-loop NTPase fold protein [Pluralibacter gergoviae]|uniref:KAP family P-loop NTPase fold protein n=1 Tax=Pluralibacter gergoviae TaxID=61647 RepID=UPI002FDA97F9